MRIQEIKKDSSLYKLKYTFLTIVKVYITIFVLYSILGLIDHLLPSIDFSIVKSIKNEDSFIKKTSILFLGLKTLFIAPIIEELIFRKPIKPSRISNITLLGVFLYSVAMIIIKSNLNFYFLGAYSIVLLFLHYFCSENKEKVIFPSLIFTSIVFGCFHINNIEVIGENLWYLYLYKTFPLIILGFGLAIIRLKLGVLWSIIGHSVFNLVPFFF